MKSIVIGGNGALGRALVSQLVKLKNRTVISIDFAANIEAGHNILVKNKVNDNDIVANIEKLATRTDAMVDSIFCVAGGWQGGNINDSNYKASIDKMFQMNLDPALAAVHLASLSSLFTPSHGLVCLVGANAALYNSDMKVNVNCSDMLGYGLSKTSTHFLVSTLANDHKFKTTHTTIVGICPEIIDTESNRKAMPTNDFSKWTKPSDIATKLTQWTADVATRPESGSLISIRGNSWV